MLVEGSPEVFTWKDGWTVATKDNGRCAQFEHTILIHDEGAEVLTWCVCYKERMILKLELTVHIKEIPLRSRAS